MTRAPVGAEDAFGCRHPIPFVQLGAQIDAQSVQAIGPAGRPERHIGRSRSRFALSRLDAPDCPLWLGYVAAALTAERRTMSPTIRHRSPQSTLDAKPDVAHLGRRLITAGPAVRD